MEVPLTSLLSPNRQLKIFFVAAVLIGIFMILVWARVFYGSMQAYQMGESYIKKGQHIKAITFFDRSIHWYAPFNPYVQRSAKRLWEIGKHAQINGDIRLALIAARTIRRGFIAARSLNTPGGDWIEKCDLRIYELLKLDQDRKGDLKGEKIDIDTVLKDPQVRGPDILWTIVLLAGLLGWIGSAIGFIMSQFRTSKATRFSISSNFKWMLFGTFFFAVWIVGMVNA
jgi:hypothetical protein